MNNVNNNFCYKSNQYERQSQRFVIPLFIKDEIGNYKQSSTATLVVKDGFHHYAIFAAHALDGGGDIKDIFYFSPDGHFYQLIEHASSFMIFEKNDVVLVDFLDKRFDSKNYFNLDLSLNEVSNNISLDFFYWIGFPLSQSKKKEIHNSKSSDSLIKEMVYTDDATGQQYIKKINYLAVESKKSSFGYDFIIGHYSKKNVEFKYKGKVSKSPSLSGMSGGAMYFTNLEKKLMDNLDESFIFAGMGIEHRDNDSIVGVSRDKIIELIKLFNEQNIINLSLKY